MIPQIAAGGCSFKGAFLYYMHDKCSDTRERIAWTHTENMLTDDPDKAWKTMAYTAKNQNRLKQASGQVTTGRKCEKPVMAYSLSWHPEQNPDKEHMLDMALQSAKVLGFTDHECLIVAHRDTPHKHVHIIVNRIHPVTGLAASNSYSMRRLSTFALDYAREHGLDYCPQREDNARKREKGERTKYLDNRIQEAWDKSDDGRSLIAALEASGLTLAHGNKRLVVVDPKGKPINPVRHIEGIRSKDFRAKLSDIDLSAIPTVDEAIERKKIRKRPNKINTKKRIQAIKDYYQINEQEKSISEIREKIQSAPWWKKMLGLNRKDKRALSTMEDEYIKTKLKADYEIKEFKTRVKRELLECHKLREAERHQGRKQTSEKRQHPPKENRFRSNDNGGSFSEEPEILNLKF